MDFLTPQVFNFLVIANLIVGLILIVGRFYYDMTRKEADANQHREQAYDESSYAALEDTNPSQPQRQLVDDDTQTQNLQK